jgi:hypothetical protein
MPRLLLIYRRNRSFFYEEFLIPSDIPTCCWGQQFQSFNEMADDISPHTNLDRNSKLQSTSKDIQIVKILPAQFLDEVTKP